MYILFVIIIQSLGSVSTLVTFIYNFNPSFDHLKVIQII